LLRVMEDDELEEHVGLDGLMVKKLRKKMVRACLTICFFVGARSRTQKSANTPTHESGRETVLGTITKHREREC